MEIALVLDDHAADVAAGVLFDPHGFAFDHVFVADLAGDFGKNRDAVRVPLAKHGAGFDFLVFLDQQDRAGGNFVFLQLAALGIQKLDFAVAGQHDLLARIVADDLQARELHDARLLGPAFVVDDRALTDAADVERTHRQLRARLADALGADDPDGHAFFDHRAGRKVHAVAEPADAQRGIASERRCGPGSFPGPDPRSGGRSSA